MRPEQSNPFTNAKIVGSGIDSDAYHRTVDGPRGSKEFIMSRSALAGFVNCPSKWRAGQESPDTTATKWGTLIDTLALTPELFDDRFAVYPDTYPCEPTNKDPRTEKPWNNNATFCKEWKAERNGKLFVHNEKIDDDGNADEDTKTATLGNARRAMARLMKDERIVSMLNSAKTQVMVRAEHQNNLTGLTVPWKMLLDIVPAVSHPQWGKTLADFKTARSADEREFAKAVHSGFYDWQAAINRDGYVAATGEDRTDFIFPVQENSAPAYETAVWLIGSDWMQDARAEVLQALDYYCTCLVNNEWPGYPMSLPIQSYGALSREAWMLRNIPRPLKSKPTPGFRAAQDDNEVTP